MVLSFYKPAAADDREICKTASGNAAIAACTRVIESKKYAKKKFKRTLSLLYADRSVEYDIKKELDEVIADHDESIKLDPKNWAAYNNRGNAYASKHHYDHAIAEYDEAVSSNRNMPRPTTIAVWRNATMATRPAPTSTSRKPRCCSRASSGH